MVAGLVGGIVVGPSATTAAETAVTQAEAIREARERYAGTWRVVAIEAGGKQLPDDGRSVLVTNAVDGSWTLSVDGKETARGTSRIDPLATPPGIDIEITAGDGQGGKWLGIYEVADRQRRLCFRGAPGQRPREFVTRPECGSVLVTFERQ